MLLCCHCAVAVRRPPPPPQQQQLPLSLQLHTLLMAWQVCYLGPINAAAEQPLAFLRSAGAGECPPYHNPADFVMEVLAADADAPDRYDIHAWDARVRCARAMRERYAPSTAWLEATFLAVG